MGSIKDMLITQVIQSGIKWMLSLLSPASAIENALKRALPVLIGLLANVLGIGGLAGKVVGLVKKIQKRVTKAIEGLWIKLKRMGRSVLSKFSRGKKKKKVKTKAEGDQENTTIKTVDWDNDRHVFTNIENDSHTLYFRDKGLESELYMQSKDDHVESHLKHAISIATTTQEKEHAQKGLNHYSNKVSPKIKTLNRLENQKIKLENNDATTKKVDILSNQINKENKLQDKELAILAKLFKKIKFEKGGQPTAEKTKVTSKQDSEGRALYVEASPLTWVPGNTKGSSPFQNPLGWDDTKDVIRSGIYIRGHMLNDNIHGPGVAWNLVPITRVMNSNMEVQAERHGKEVLSSKHKIMWYKTTIIDYYNNTDNKNDRYFPVKLKVEWGEFKNSKGEYDPKGKIINKQAKEFSQGKPALPFNINDLGETLLIKKLSLNPKFAKAITEERKVNGWFDTIRGFENRMEKYYEKKVDNNKLDIFLDKIIYLENTQVITF